jgi:hypothetical protein
MNKLLFLFLFIGIKVFSQTDTLTAIKAQNQIDKEVIVKGIIAGARLFEKDGKKTFLINLDEKYPNTPLTVVLYDNIYDALVTKDNLENKKIVAKGIVTLHKDRPQVVITDLKNLTIY